MKQSGRYWENNCHTCCVAIAMFCFLWMFWWLNCCWLINSFKHGDDQWTVVHQPFCFRRLHIYSNCGGTFIYQATCSIGNDERSCPLTKSLCQQSCLQCNLSFDPPRPLLIGTFRFGDPMKLIYTSDFEFGLFVKSTQTISPYQSCRQLQNWRLAAYI